MSGPGWWHHYSKWFGEFLNGTLRGDGGECCRGCRESGHLATDPTHSRRRGLLSEGGRWRRWFGEALCCVDTLYYLWVGHSDLMTLWLGQDSWERPLLCLSCKVWGGLDSWTQSCFFGVLPDVAVCDCNHNVITEQPWVRTGASNRVPACSRSFNQAKSL